MSYADIASIGFPLVWLLGAVPAGAVAVFSLRDVGREDDLTMAKLLLGMLFWPLLYCQVALLRVGRGVVSLWRR